MEHMLRRAVAALPLVAALAACSDTGSPEPPESGSILARRPSPLLKACASWASAFAHWESTRSSSRAWTMRIGSRVSPLLTPPIITPRSPQRFTMPALVTSADRRTRVGMARGWRSTPAANQSPAPLSRLEACRRLMRPIGSRHLGPQLTSATRRASAIGWIEPIRPLSPNGPESLRPGSCLIMTSMRTGSSGASAGGRVLARMRVGRTLGWAHSAATGPDARSPCGMGALRAASSASGRLSRTAARTHWFLTGAICLDRSQSSSRLGMPALSMQPLHPAAHRLETAKSLPALT